MAEFLEIARSGEFVLSERTDVAQSGWRNLKLETVKHRKQKNNWWLAWNGTRFAMNADTSKLEKHFPEAVAWVKAIMDTTPPHREAAGEGV